jgi:hypothetical protein
MFLSYVEIEINPIQIYIYIFIDHPQQDGSFQNYSYKTCSKKNVF